MFLAMELFVLLVRIVIGLGDFGLTLCAKVIGPANTRRHFGAILSGVKAE
jgi:hypothetical protein